MARKPLALGAYINDAKLGGQAPFSPQAIDAYAALIGHRPAHIMWYQPWIDPNSRQFVPFPTTLMETVRAKGMAPMLTWEPNDPSYPSGFDDLVTSGHYDPFLAQWFLAARRWGHYFILRFAWEMNTPVQFYGGVQQPPAAYVSMWRHVHDLAKRVGAVNIDWFWCPNTDYTGCAALASVFPGDGYVDLVGLDGYNWGHSDQYHWWTTCKDVFLPSYLAVCGLSSKPVVIGETASADDGSSKGAWITQAFLTDFLSSFERLEAVTWFNQPKEQAWPVDSSPDALAAYRAVAASPLWQGVLA